MEFCETSRCAGDGAAGSGRAGASAAGCGSAGAVPVDSGRASAHAMCAVSCVLSWLRPAVRRYAAYTHTAATSSLLQHTGGESGQESASAYMADAYQTSAACVRGMTRRGACLALDSR